MAKIRHKLQIILFVAVIATSTLTAKDNLWIGLGFSAGYDNIGTEYQDHYKGYHTGSPDKNLSRVQRIGPSVELSYFMPFFPYIGIHVESRTLIPVGFMLDKEYFFMSRMQNFSEKVLFGITGNIYMNEAYGFFLNLDGDITINRNAKVIHKNSRLPSEYLWYTTYGMSGSFGTFANNADKAFFKMGISFSHDFATPEWDLGLTLSGGIII